MDYYKVTYKNKKPAATLKIGVFQAASKHHAIEQAFTKHGQIFTIRSRYTAIKEK